MRLFTTRPRRSDHPPEVRPVDLAAVGAAHKRLPASTHGRHADAIARELTRSCGRRCEPLAVAGGDPETDIAATVRAGGGLVVIRLDRSTRRVWLGVALGLPAGRPDDHELPRDPTPIEREVLGRTLLVPVALAVLDTTGEAGVSIDWQEPETVHDDLPRGRTHRLAVSTPTGPLDLRVGVAMVPGSSRAGTALDRSVRMSSLPLVIQLDPGRAGVALSAADLARFEPGDILLTDLVPEAAGGLPVEAVGAGPTPSHGPFFRLKGRFGVSGTRRGVRFDAAEAFRSSDR